MATSFSEMLEELERRKAAVPFSQRFQEQTTTEQVQDQVGANFDAENSAPLSLRFSLARGDTFREKEKRLQRRFPEGQLRTVSQSIVTGKGPEDTILLFRENPESQWKRVNPEGFETGDVVEAFAPSVEAIVGETAVAAATRGGSIAATVGRQALGALTGEAVEQTIQSARGLQDQSITGIATEPLVEGGLSAAGGFLVSPLVAIGNIGRGSGILQVGEEGIDALQAANRLGVGDLMTPGLVADNPVVRISENQARSLLPAVNRRYREISTGLSNAIEAGADRSAIPGFMRQTLESLKTQGNKTKAKLQVASTKGSEGGRALQEGIAEYDLVANRVVDDLYSAARAIDEPNFDFTPLENLAQDLRAGAKGTIDPKTEALLKEIESIKGPIALSDGGEVTISQQLRNARTQAYANKFVPEGQVADQATGQASDIFNTLNDVLDNPVNADANFVNAWRQASDAARERFTTLEQAAVIKTAKSADPAELVDQFAQPRKVDSLKTLRDTVDPRRWNTFRNAVYSDWLRQPDQLLNKIDDFDQETLDVLIPRSEQPLWRKVAREFDRIAKIGAEDIAEVQVSNKNFIGTIIEEANPRKALTLRRSIKNKGHRDALRAGIIDWAWDGVATVEKGRVNINRKLFEDRIARLKSNNLWTALTPDQRRLISDVDRVARQFQILNDAGTSIRSAEAASGAAQLRPSAISALLQSNLIGNFMLSPAGRAFFIGSGKPSSRGQTLRLMGGVLAQVGATEDLETLE